MIDRTTKLRWRRRIRHSRRQVEDLGLHAEEHLERHFFRRIGRLLEVRRFIISWVLLLVLLMGGLIVQTKSLTSYYLSLQAAGGGTYTEGVLGAFTNANPLYATGIVDGSVSRLIFSGLFKTDQSNTLVGDLADGWKVDERAVVYTVHLRNNLLWHDGKPLTADDVVFTYRTIQNPDAKSPLFTSWQGITVMAKDARTVVFTLPNSLSSFPYSLVNGIVPKHLLEQVPISQLRSVRFNTTNPVGSGPFALERIEVSGDKPENREEKIGLKAFARYHAGAPGLDRFVIRSFHDEGQMVSSFKKNQIDGMVGLDGVPESLQKQAGLQQYNVPLSGEVTLFLKTTSDNLKDVKVRQALIQSADQQDIIQNLGYPVIAANEPLIKSDVGYNATLAQLPRNITTANKLLDDAGWAMGAKGYRTKEGKQLTIRLFAQNTSEYTYITQKLQKQWREVGVDVQVQLEPSVDLQSVVSRHDYDALLYGISIGPDPDVFAYWHSSQADPHASSRLNLSEYKSTVADKSLEAGRTRTDATIRAIKYRPFLEAWRNDAPALVLYQPRFLYITRTPISGFSPHAFNTASDRFSNVSEWMIRKEKLPL